MVDEKYRIFGVVNPIDLLVLLGLLVAAFVGYRVLFPQPTVNKTQLKDVTYTVVAPRLRFWDSSFVKPGDTISKRGGSPIGTVVSVDATAAAVEYVDPARGPLVYASTTSQDVYIKVKAKGDPTNLGVVIGGVALHNNTELGIATEFFEASEAFVTSLTVGP